MPLQLHRVPPSLSPSASFNDLTHCICESYAVPRNRLWRLFRHDPTPAGFIELRDRLMREYRADADATRACWLTIVDTDIGDKVVGAALWHTYLENPYPRYEEHPVEAYWWPEGEFFVLLVVVVCVFFAFFPLHLIEEKKSFCLLSEEEERKRDKRCV